MTRNTGLPEDDRVVLRRLGESSDVWDTFFPEAEREPDIISNWMKVVNIHLKLNNEEKARETIQLASSKNPNKIDALTTSYALSGVFSGKKVWMTHFQN